MLDNRIVAYGLVISIYATLMSVLNFNLEGGQTVEDCNEHSQSTVFITKLGMSGPALTHTRRFRSEG